MSEDEESKLHLEILESPTGKYVFQVKPVRPGCEVRPRSRYCSFEDAQPWLRECNDAGCAVYVQVQDGTGPTTKAITYARTFFLDFDGNNPPPTLPFEPTLILKTKNGWHVYFRILPSLEFSRWRSMQVGLARECQSDPYCVGLNQKARLAGFYHHKKDPFLIRIERANRVALYSIDDFQKFSDLTTEVEATERSAYPVRSVTWNFPLRRYWLNALLRELRAAVPGTRFITLRRVAFQLGCYASIGLDAKIAITKMREIAGGWIDYDQADARRTITRCFEQGYAYALIHPPHTPPEQARENELFERRVEFEEMLRCFELEEKVTVEEILSALPQWTCAYDAVGSARRAVAGQLRSRGYEERRSKSTRFYVRATTNQS